MALKLVDRIRLAREELDGQTTDSTNNVDGTIDVVEAIQQENDAVEITELQNEVESDAAAMEELEEVQGDLEEQAQEDEEIIEGVEENVIDETEVKPENVQASQEALRIAMKRLGENVRGSNFLSHEEISNNPYRALKMSHEGIKEWIDKIIEGIKSLYKKIVEFIKKIWVKIKAFFGNLEAKLENLENILKAKEKKGLDKVNNLNADKEKAIAAAFGPYLFEVIDGEVSNLSTTNALGIDKIIENVKKKIEVNNKLILNGAKSFSTESLSTEKFSNDQKAKIHEAAGGKASSSDFERIHKLLKEGNMDLDSAIAVVFNAPTSNEANDAASGTDGSSSKTTEPVCGSKDYVVVVRKPDFELKSLKVNKDSFEEDLAEYKESLNKYSRELKVEKVKIIFKRDTSKLEKVTVSQLLKVVKTLKDVVKKKSKLDEMTKALENSESNVNKLSVKVSDDNIAAKAAIAQFKLRSKIGKEATMVGNEEITCLFNNIKSAIAGVAKLTSYVSEEKEEDDKD